eukprot:9425321-Pyramimonas_sp.AAC.1
MGGRQWGVRGGRDGGEKKLGWERSLRGEEFFVASNCIQQDSSGHWLAAKRRRQPGGVAASPAASSGNFSTPMKDRISDVKDDVDGDAKSMVSDLSCGGSASACKEKDPCLGCKRVFGVSRCYFNPAEPVPWGLPAGRGAWCKDCHTCWRTVYREEYTLPVFGDWMTRHRDSWEKSSLAYLSLKFEKYDKITAGMVKDRVRVLNFVSNLIGVPLTPFVVISLKDAAAKAAARNGRLDPASLVAIFHGSSPQLG